MLEVPFQLGRTGFVDQGVHVELHRLGVVVHHVEDRIEFVDRVDRIRLARGFRPTGAPRRGLQREIGVGVLLHQEELELRRDDGLEAHRVVKAEHVPQHAARRQLVRRAIARIAVVDDLRGRVDRPRHHAHRFRVRPQVHVRIGRRHQLVVLVGVVTGNRGDEDALG